MNGETIVNRLIKAAYANLQGLNTASRTIAVKM